MISTHIAPRLPKGGLWMLIISCIVLGHTSCSKEKTPDIITPEPDTTVFAEIVYDGFTVKIREYLKNTPDATAALNLMKANLDTIMTVVPDTFLTVMRKNPIWMEKDVKPDGAAWYHVSEQWLIENHMDPRKVKCVEICNYVNYVSWTQQNQPIWCFTNCVIFIMTRPCLLIILLLLPPIKTLALRDCTRTQSATTVTAGTQQQLRLTRSPITRNISRNCPRPIGEETTISHIPARN